MKICGIISEYNPFHNGHRYQIEQARKMGATHIVAVMSGAVVQRGEAAVFDKHFRAKTACENGADLVVELPCPYSIASAELFALGAVSVLKGLGAVDAISFGCETNDAELMEKAVFATESLKNSEEVRRLIKSGESYPSAVFSVCRKRFGEEVAAMLSSPNNTLGIEYLRAAKRLGISLEPLPVKRKGASHDSGEVSGNFASASKIRELILSGEAPYALVPYKLNGDVFNTENMWKAAVFRLMSMSREELAAVPDCPDGLASRISLYLEKNLPKSLSELYDGVKTKNMTHARVRRVVLYSLLGIRKSDFSLSVYGRVLAANKRGTEILAASKGAASMPVSHSLSKLKKLGGDYGRLAELDVISTGFQKLCAEKDVHFTPEFSVKFETQE